MKIMTKILIVVTIVTIGLSCPFVATAAPQQLTDGDIAHLIFMRSEEKLARDVYLTLGAMYPNMPVFHNIACRAEQTHTEQINGLFDKFNISEMDPEPDTVTVDGCPDPLPVPPDIIGKFGSGNDIFKEYFENKYNNLIMEAGVGELEAALVGALIEELDMKDINDCNDVIYEKFSAVVECGLTVTDVRALENTLGNLLAGSENHLCAFISQIGPMIYPECYEQQYLTQQEVWDIIDAQCSEFSDFVCKPLQQP